MEMGYSCRLKVFHSSSTTLTRGTEIGIVGVLQVSQLCAEYMKDESRNAPILPSRYKYCLRWDIDKFQWRNQTSSLEAKAQKLVHEVVGSSATEHHKTRSGTQP
jgi:hypothetical protein